MPPALESPCALSLPCRCAGTCRLDRIGGRTEFVRRHVRDNRRLAGGVSRMAWRRTQIPGGGHCMAPCRACLGHGDFAPCPGRREFDRLTRSRVLGASRFEETQDMLRARRRPQGEEVVIRIGEGPTATDRHQTRVAFFREDQPATPPARTCQTATTMPLHLERSQCGHRPCNYFGRPPDPLQNTEIQRPGQPEKHVAMPAPRTIRALSIEPRLL